MGAEPSTAQDCREVLVSPGGCCVCRLPPSPRLGAWLVSFVQPADSLRDVPRAAWAQRVRLRGLGPGRRGERAFTRGRPSADGRLLASTTGRFVRAHRRGQGWLASRPDWTMGGERTFAAALATASPGSWPRRGMRAARTPNQPSEMHVISRMRAGASASHGALAATSSSPGGSRDDRDAWPRLSWVARRRRMRRDVYLRNGPRQR